jgi:Ulp1 family protease
MNVMSYAVVSRLPQQTNDYDCGLMTCLNLRTLSEVEAAVEDIDYNVNAENFS